MSEKWPKWRTEAHRRYRRKLRKCGFTGWSKANERRAHLIGLKVSRKATPDELSELAELQKLASLKIRTLPSVHRSYAITNRILKNLEQRVNALKKGHQ